MRGGYSPARGLQNTNPQWVVAPEKKNTDYEQEPWEECPINGHDAMQIIINTRHKINVR